MNAEQERSKQKQTIQQIEGELASLEYQEKVAKDQLENGVEVKNGFRKTHNSE